MDAFLYEFANIIPMCFALLWIILSRCDEYKLTVLTTILCSYLHKRVSRGIHIVYSFRCGKHVVWPQKLLFLRLRCETLEDPIKCLCRFFLVICKNIRAFSRRYYDTMLRIKIFEYFDLENVLFYLENVLRSRLKNAREIVERFWSIFC